MKLVNLIDFRNWLVKEQGLSERSSRDIVCRLSRLSKIEPKCSEKDLDLTKYFLEKNEDFNNLSMFVKSQLRRSLTLYKLFLDTK